MINGWYGYIFGRTDDDTAAATAVAAAADGGDGAVGGELCMVHMYIYSDQVKC